MTDSIIIVDDEKNIRSSLRGILEDEGYTVEAVGSAEEAVESVQNNPPNIVFLDVMLPGMNGIDALKKIKKLSPDSYIIMMSGHATLEMAVEATRSGAYNFLEKPLIPEKVLLEIEHITSRKSMQAEVNELRKLTGRDDMIGSAPCMAELRKLIIKIAASDSRVFITGENGTGKELVARAVHVNSSRHKKPFIKINCAALPKDLIESELFGYEKGAFTGAVTRKTGRIEEAHSGTLFLDEIGDMSLDTQAKLLRVLEENELVRLGGNKTIQFDVRIISATNQDIPRLIDDGSFREDLYYRLRVMPIEVPALRERRTDVPLLVNYFSRQFAEQNNKPLLVFDEESINILIRQEWRGNIRELKNVIERIAIMAESPVMTAGEIVRYLPDPAGTSTGKQEIPDLEGRSLRQVTDEFEQALLRREFERHNGNVSKLAAALKVDRANLHRKLKQLGVK
ncbi:sigma-54-dependent transcriptional regulator [candidate division KSB1 bacterium]